MATAAKVAAGRCGAPAGRRPAGRRAALFGAAGAVLGAGLARPKPALAITTVELSGLTAEPVACPPGLSTMVLSKPACVRVTATARSPAKATLRNVDVFGRVFGADGENALDNDAASDAGRVASISAVEPGTTEITFDLIVSPRALETGLVFKGFKGRAFPATRPPSLTEEEVDCYLLSDGCGDPEDAVPFY